MSKSVFSVGSQSCDPLRSTVLVGLVGLSVAAAAFAEVKGPAYEGRAATLAAYANDFVVADIGSGQIAGLAFDGSHLYTANLSDNSVSKVSQAGVTESRYSLVRATAPTIKPDPVAIAFDGQRLWTANETLNSVSRVTVSGTGTGQVVSVIDVPLAAGARPLGLAVLREYVYTVNAGTNDVAKVRAGGVDQTYPLPADVTRPAAIASDGANLWIASLGPTTGAAPSVTRLNPSGGATSRVLLPKNSAPVAIAFDGTHVWTANSGTNTVSKIAVDTLKVVGTYSLPAGSSPAAIAIDQPGYSSSVGPIDPSIYIWTANVANNTVSKIDAATGRVVANYPVGRTPGDIAFDGTHVWVSGGNVLMKIRAR
jgi:YVTN family beta-propeller protein